MEPSPLRKEDFPDVSFSRKRDRSNSSQIYKRNKSTLSTNVDGKTRDTSPQTSVTLFSPAKLPSDKSLVTGSYPSPSLLPRHGCSSLSPQANPFQPITIPSASSSAMATPVVIPPLIKSLRDKGLSCPYASYSSSSINVVFPGRLADVDGPTSSTLIASLRRAEDWQGLDKYSSVELENRAAINELKAMGYRAMQSHCAQSFDQARLQIEELSNSIKRLREEKFHLQNVVAENSSSDVEVMKKKITNLEAEVQHLQQRDAEHEEMVRSNLTLLEKAEGEKKKLQDEMDDLSRLYEASKVSLTKVEEDHKREITSATEASFLRGQIIGAHICKSYVLMTPPGQPFLRTLVEGLIEDFLHSPYFWEMMKAPLVHWIVSIVDSCFVQLKIDDDRLSEIDTDALCELFRGFTPTLKSHTPDPSHGPWYMRCLGEATRLLSSSSDVDAQSIPAWGEILFPVLGSEGGKLGLLHKFFEEAKILPPKVYQELMKIEEQAALLFHQHVSQNQAFSSQIPDSDQLGNEIIFISGSPPRASLDPSLASTPFSTGILPPSDEPIITADVPSEDISTDAPTTLEDSTT